MQKLNLLTFLLFSGLIISSHNIFGMEKRCEKMEIDTEKVEKLELETEDASDITEINASEPEKKASDSIKFIYDEDGNFYCDQIYPFITEQKSATTLRQTCKAVNKAFCEYSKKYRPIIIKRIEPKNIDEFLILLEKNHKNIDFYVEITLYKITDYYYDLRDYYSSTDFIFIPPEVGIKKIFKLLWDKLKRLNLLFCDLINFDLEDLNQSNIIILEICAIDNLTIAFFKKLPKQLEILIVKEDDLRDDFFENLPLTLKCLNLSNNTNVTGQFSKSLAMPLEKVKLYVHTEENNLEYLPKNLKCLDIGWTFIRNYSGLKNLQNLTALCVNAKFTDDDFKKLPQSLIALNICLCENIFGQPNNIIGKGFKDLPKNLKAIKFYSLKKIDKQYLTDLPKSVRKVYIKDDYLEVINDISHKEKIAIIREMGIRVLNRYGEKYPDHKDKPTTFHGAEF